MQANRFQGKLNEGRRLKRRSASSMSASDTCNGKHCYSFRKTIIKKLMEEYFNP